MALQHVLVFGDQTVEKLPSIQNLTKLSKTSGSLRRFLQEATDVVQIETTRVSWTERKAFDTFNNILALAEHNTKQDDPDEVVSTVVMCIERLGELILYAERDPSILATSDPNLHILGFCTGLLPGVAAAFARDTSELFKYGLEMVSISFRLAIELNRRSRRIEESAQSWARTIVGVTATEIQGILDDFNLKQGLPTLSHTYLGVVSRTWTSVFGPPSILEKLWSWSSDLALAPKLHLAAHTAVHAKHLPPLNLEKIVGSSPLLDTSMPTKVSVISTSTCKPFVASNLHDLLYLIIQDIAQNTLHMEGTIQAVVSSVLGKGSVELLAVGPTPHTVLVQRALQSSEVTFNMTKALEPLQQIERIRGGTDRIAIVGMSGRFPGGDDISEFWETLSNGVDVHQEIPKSRFDVDAYFDATGTVKNSTKTQYGCFMKNPGVFDSRLFNISPREAMQMDPLQRLLLMTSYEAMEAAGYFNNGSLSTNSSRIATYFGQSGDDWRSINESQGIDIYYIPGGVRAFAPGRVNYHFKWGGGYYSVDTACSSSSTTVHLACSALIARECDTALAGGGSLLTAPEMYAGLSRGGFLSTTGGCRTYSDDADGYCRGEGMGVVVLKRLEDAIADNDNIQAVIRGTARSYSADAVSITQPHIETQKQLFKSVLQRADVLPEEVNFIEMHGTATQAGDTAEMTSVTSVFGKKRSKDNPLVLGTVKANVGHGEAAAGITSLIKAVLMFNKNAIPPQAGMPFATNHKFPALEHMNIRIAEKLTKFTAYVKGDGKRKILLNNFDAAGGNTSLLIEDPPAQERRTDDPRSYHVVACSARTIYSLKENKQRLSDYLYSYPDVKISDLAYTTTARRLHEVCRTTYVAQTVAELHDRLRADIGNTKEELGKPSSGSSAIIFAFTGQGSQYAGMGSQLFHTSLTFQELILSYQELCDIQGLPSFVSLIADDQVSLESKCIVQVQLAIVSLEIALANLWRSWGIQPNLLIGHSLGEYAALCIAGVLSVSDTLYLVGKRALLLKEKCTPSSHSMLAIASSSASVEVILDEKKYSSCQVSCVNSPSMTVVSGMSDEIKTFQDYLQKKSVKSTVLQVPYGFHSSQIDPILVEFGIAAKGCHFAKPLIPVVSTLTTSMVEDSETFNSAYLVKQARNAVQYAGALQTCMSRGLINRDSLFLEIGPHPVCLGLIRSNIDITSDKLLSTLRSGENNWKTISATIAAAYTSQISIDWPEFHKDYVKSLTLLELPTYAFDLKTYWASYKKDKVKAVSTTAPTTAAPISKFSTTCLQRVEESLFEDDQVSVRFTSDTSEPRLYDAIQGHVVDGVALCPASVFYDMAFTAAKYIYTEKYPGKSVPNMELINLEITHPLVVTSIDHQQKIKVIALSSRPDASIDIHYTSTQGTSSHEHGHCKVLFRDQKEWLSEWSRSRLLVKKRVDDLVQSAQSGDGHGLMKPVVYKLFANIVLYDQKYQALEKVFVNSDFTDATAKVKLKSGFGFGSFTYSPYWTDAIVHLSGFVLNGSYTKPDDIAYISTGVESFRIIGELNKDEEYICYTSIQPSEDKRVSIGNVYLFRGVELVALCTGIKFQKMTKAVFRIISGRDSTTDFQNVGSSAKRMTAKHNLPAVKSILAKGDKLPLHSTVSTDSGNESYGDAFVGSTDTPPSSIDQENILDNAEILLNLVATETEFDAADMQPSTLFSDMGVDSLMSIAIISAFKKKTGVELPASFFNNLPTVAEVRQELACTSEATSASNPAPAVPLPAASLPSPKQRSAKGKQPVHSTREKGQKQKPPVTKRASSPPPIQEANCTIASNVVLMQGRLSNKETPLFLIADGAGSSTAYIHLSPLSGGRRIYALESPYLQAPEEFNCTISDVCLLYLAALRRTQPEGPYLLGGWSAGGVYAYETARLLLAQGERVQGLIIIDMRVPKSIPDAPEPTMELVEQTGLITGITRSGNLLDLISQRQKKHLLGTLKALVTFDPLPMALGYQPDNTCIIWATLGLDETAGIVSSNSVTPASMGQVGSGLGKGNNMEDPETGLRSWFFAKRYTFGPNGWDKLVGKKDIECHKVKADHFSMMSPPAVKELGQILEQVVKKFTA